MIFINLIYFFNVPLIFLPMHYIQTLLVMMALLASLPNCWISVRKGSFPLTVSLPGFVMRQDILLRLAVQYVPIVSRAVDWLYPVTRRIDYFNPSGSTFPAARDQHRYHACG